jgi:hypothetical protein
MSRWSARRRPATARSLPPGRSGLLTEVVLLVMTYETSFQVLIWSSQMLYVCPPRVTLLATTEPAGSTPPLSLSQIIISSALGWPEVVGLWLYQMS